MLILRTTQVRLTLIFCLFKAGDYKINNEFDNQSGFDWKNHMKIGYGIKLNWMKGMMNKKTEIPNFFEDSRQMCEELYTVLKGILLFTPEFYYLPKLRKEIIFVENTLNTTHQKYMYDFVYDQQDIYDYYDEVFEEKNKSMFYEIKVRQEYQPFSQALVNFDSILSEFSEENEGRNLANLRWYIFHSNFESGNKMIIDDYNQNGFNNLNDDMMSIFSTTFTENNYSTKLIEEYQVKNPNSILSLMNSLVLYLSFICKTSYNYILKYQSNDQLYMDCYLKIVKFT